MLQACCLLNTAGLFQRGHHTANFLSSGKFPWSPNSLSTVTLKLDSFMTGHLVYVNLLKELKLCGGAGWQGGWWLKSKREEREAVLGDQQGRVGHFSTRGACVSAEQGEATGQGPGGSNRTREKSLRKFLCSGLIQNCTLKCQLIQGFTWLNKGDQPGRRVWNSWDG